MATMVMMLDISEEQAERLTQLQSERGVSREQLVQEAIAAYLPPVSSPLIRQFGVLKGQVEDGMAFQDRMRQEWDRSR